MTDSERWSNDCSPAPESNARWQFGIEKEDLWMENITLCIVDITTMKQHTFSVHKKLGLALAYLDMDYWLTPWKTVPPTTVNRVSRYLKQLREDVAAEMLLQNPNTLVDAQFAPFTLREWAIRARGGYGHSNTGRTEYRRFCQDKGLPVYADDFVNFGENYI
jgi:hypothetical protein